MRPPCPTPKLLPLASNSIYGARRVTARADKHASRTGKQQDSSKLNRSNITNVQRLDAPRPPFPSQTKSSRRETFRKAIEEDNEKLRRAMMNRMEKFRQQQLAGTVAGTQLEKEMLEQQSKMLNMTANHEALPVVFDVLVPKESTKWKVVDEKTGRKKVDWKSWRRMWDLYVENVKYEFRNAYSLYVIATSPPSAALRLPPKRRLIQGSLSSLVDGIRSRWRRFRYVSAAASPRTQVTLNDLQAVNSKDILEIRRNDVAVQLFDWSRTSRFVQPFRWIPYLLSTRKAGVPFEYSKDGICVTVNRDVTSRETRKDWLGWLRQELFAVWVDLNRAIASDDHIELERLCHEDFVKSLPSPEKSDKRKKDASDQRIWKIHDGPLPPSEKEVGVHDGPSIRIMSIRTQVGDMRENNPGPGKNRLMVQALIRVVGWESLEIYDKYRNPLHVLPNGYPSPPPPTRSVYLSGSSPAGSKIPKPDYPAERHRTEQYMIVEKKLWLIHTPWRVRERVWLTREEEQAVDLGAPGPSKLWDVVRKNFGFGRSP